MMTQTASKPNRIKDFCVYLPAVFGLLLAARFLPLIGTAAMFVWSLPVILCVIRDGLPWGAALAAAAAALCFLLMGPGDGFLAAGIIAGFGFGYGAALKKKAAPGKTLLVGIIVSAALVAVYFLLAGILGLPAFDDVAAAVNESVDEFFEVYGSAGLLDAAVAEGMTVQSYKAQLVSAMTGLLPSFFIVFVTAMAAVNYIFAQYVLKKRGEDIRALPPFENWHLPWWTLWGVLIALMLLVFGNFFDREWMGTAARNIFCCYAPVLLVGGVSLARWFFLRVKLSAGIQTVLWVIAFITMSFSMIFLILMGAADAALDYRTAMEKRKNNLKNGGLKR
ncbi:MAG: YybS family protein [Bacillota bacterium]|jgi:uncharacterized protein YybS (DUF2232 family)